ncbi:DUF2523 family protein [Ralstonia pseudosolanacearum]|uniref:DUF2523 family protein n=1 Tax=Ralstonia pseudosolanacearum TaxID=1310165 RepID=UPI000B61682E|nr:DUF2523 family protein [Ralstonia pseudosolanacearum]ASL74984.1 hypothetical protein BC350_16235 [Ralstonia pseudosolanacearum]RAA16239.1 DUF2523 domain-containing protein [Ralstonia pseudosolanacearum]
MMPLAGFLMALVGPLARQLLVSLGIGLITYVGLDAAVSAALGAAKSSLAGMPAVAAAILARGGVFTGLSIIAGGITARISMITLKRLGKLI